MAKGSRSQYKRDERNAVKDTRAHASAKFIRLSDTKARIVLEQIKGKNVGEAMAILSYSPRYAAGVIEKLLKSAVANAENNLGIDPSKLFVEEVFANQGPTLKRIRPRAKGMAYRINKKTSHLSIILNER
ncbi:MAG: 50S ribosomal protein L22 [Clostridiales bacterium]|jgi:large subunit ribosomal protein L22|nr:50S ribosomal protein L22 [Clostridiales bacterium]